MKILVAVKRVIDPYVRVRIKSDGNGVETHNVKMSMNPFDEIALEEAIRLREKNSAAEVVIVTIGDNTSQETLRHGLALGADRAIHVQTDNQYCSLNIAKILQKITLDESPSIVIMGKQSIDGDNNQTPQMLAGLLNWPQATYASTIQISGETITVSREIDAGLETLSVQIPAVISVDLRLNEPRYASLPNIMKAKQKPLINISLDSLGLVLKEHRKILKITNPTVRKAGIKVDSITSLLDKLQQEAKVI
ncbi:MAG: electron transfer flavoprotein subunit beta/FixA family protein [Legionellaceae bacterium]|nr:electron transfer flavoprotein subunit beta/FixA family protein [Legionellaceae bacterium]